MVGPVSLGRNLFNSGVGTWRNSPEEWGGQWEGFGRRVASNLGRNVIRQTTIYGLDEALKLDSGYYRAKGKSTGAKIKNGSITADDIKVSSLAGVPSAAAATNATHAAAAAGLDRVVQVRGLGLHVDDIGLRRPTLDEVFLTLTGQPTADQDGARGAADDLEGAAA